jgi:hypothetical protein
MSDNIERDMSEAMSTSIKPDPDAGQVVPSNLF